MERLGTIGDVTPLGDCEDRVAGPLGVKALAQARLSVI